MKWHRFEKGQEDSLIGLEAIGEPNKVMLYHILKYPGKFTTC